MDKVLFKEKKNLNVRQMEGNSFNWTVIINLVFIVISGYFIFNSFRSFQQTQEKLQILERAKEEVTNLRLRNISLLLDKEKIETDDFTQIDIRNRLNYSKKNEIVFVIPQETLELSNLEVERILKEDEEKIAAKSTWDVWFEAFWYGI